MRDHIARVPTIGRLAVAWLGLSSVFEALFSDSCCGCCRHCFLDWTTSCVPNLVIRRLNLSSSI